MARDTNHHSRIKALLLTTALVSGFATNAQAQQVIDTPVTAPVVISTDGTLLVTTPGAVGVTANGEDAVTLGPSVNATITNNSFISSTLGSGIVVGPLATLDLANTGYVLGDIAAIMGGNGAFVSGLNNQGLIQGDVDGIRLENGTLQNVVNAGQITGFSGTGIYLRHTVSGGAISNFRNTSTGVIEGGFNGVAIRADTLSDFTNEGIIGRDDAIGIIVSGNNPLLSQSVGDFTNAAGGQIYGTISGVTIEAGDAVNFTNAGTITANGSNSAGLTHKYGLNLNNGTLTNFTNSGLIEASNNSTTALAFGVAADTIDGMVNTGTIRATNPLLGGYTRAVTTHNNGGGIISLTNAGGIYADLAAVNNGLAIYESPGGSSTDLYLLPGSVIQGQIYLGNVGTDTIHVADGMNLTSVIQNGGSVIEIEAGDALMATQTVAGNLLVAVADTSVLSASDNAQSAMTGALSGIVAERLATDLAQVTRVDQSAFGPYGTQHNRPDWWAKGFGGVGHLRGDGPAVATNYAFGGLAAGADLISNNGLRYGLFAGASTGQVKADVANGQELDNNSFFIGGYGRYEAQNFYLNYGLTAGYTQTDSSRIVGNNLVVGGLETASASYGSYFLAPEVTIGSENWQIGQMGLQPSLRLRYTYMQSEGYTETGLTDGNLTVSDRDTHVIDARAQLAMPMRHFGPDTDFGLRVGVDGHFVMGGDFDATLLGQTTSGFDAGGASSSAFGFVGVDVEHRLNDTSHLFLSAEAGTGTETSFAGTIEAGFRMKF